VFNYFETGNRYSIFLSLHILNEHFFMNIVRLLPWRKHHEPKNTTTASRVIDDAIKESAEWHQSVNPETDAQWQHLKIALDRKHSEGYDQRGDTRREYFKPAFSFAVAAAVLIVTGVLWLRYSSDKIYETRKGQHSTITLQDNTEVTLNAQSELKVNRWPLEKARLVSLKGEAFFHVQKNGTPFIVSTEMGNVQVLGTEFNVRVRENHLEVAVVKGRVMMSVMRHGKDSSVVLSGGQIAECTQNDFPEMPTSIPFPQYPGWIHGKFIFNRSSLLSACREMESQFDVVIRLENPQLYDKTITGTIDGQSIEAALTTFTALTGNKYRYENIGYTIY
jgi:transmembrane sensor